jgi:hypothetical protein
MSANNVFAFGGPFSAARVSVSARCTCARVDPEYTIPSRVPVVSPKWMVETRSDGTKRLLQHWAVMTK